MSGINLRDYQLEAVKEMKNGCILCGGVGSGKSRTSLAYYYICNGGKLETKNYVKMKNPCDLYIITTARKRDTLEWEEELIPFLLTTKTMKKDQEKYLYSNKVVIDSWNKIKKYVGVHDAFFIFDEQRVVGSGEWVKAFLKITKVNKWILLSATPGDTWQDYIPVFLANGFYKNRTEFNRQHVIFDRFAKYPKVNRYIDIRKLTRLRDSILVDMDFKRETQPIHIDIWCEYDRDLYKYVIRNRWDIYKNEPIQNAAGICYVWRKIVNSSNNRQLKLLEIFENHPKCIIFYNFDYELDILRNLYAGIEKPGELETAEWNGHKHEPIPKSKSWAYFVQYSAGAEGWNCIETDTIIFYSQNYSYKIMEQAAGRIDRMNTPFKTLYFYHLKSRAPIDSAIGRSLANKKKFNERKFVKW